MKGVILAGGLGTRLFPLTKVTNKHLLPVYKKPMIYYPIETLLDAGIKNILIVTGEEHAGHFLKLLGNGKEFGAKFTYELQYGNTGISDALRLAEDFAGDEKIVVVLGDNILSGSIREIVQDFEKGEEEAGILLKEVPNAERFGVAELEGDKVVGIEEKPKTPKTNFAVIGVYMYSPAVFELIKSLKPSARGEYEITDVNNAFIKRGTMKAGIYKGEWTDAGTFESLYRATVLMKELEEKKGK
ncbi:MAG: sugar phosphate nucleotidyltransferase [Candidatus Diapherotrites archaeon]